VHGAGDGHGGDARDHTPCRVAVPDFRIYLGLAADGAATRAFAVVTAAFAVVTAAFAALALLAAALAAGATRPAAVR
jgi:hypothetical protein